MNNKVYSYKTRPQRLCNSCGKCCTMAVCRYTREELKEFSKCEESEAGDFLKVFIPYENLDIPNQISKEYVDLILANLKKQNLYKENEPVFYHCKYINKDNSCAVYENRFGWCKRMPNHGWTVVPVGCGFEGWQFLLREQIKHSIRLLKEYLYECETLYGENGEIPDKNMNVKVLKNLVNDKIECFKRFGAELW